MTIIPVLGDRRRRIESPKPAWPRKQDSASKIKKQKLKKIKYVPVYCSILELHETHKLVRNANCYDPKIFPLNSW
jgi:hypothetical protein